MHVKENVFPTASVVHHLILFVFLGQGRKVTGNPHDDTGSLGRWQEGEEPGDEAFPLPDGHDHQTLLIAHSAGKKEGENEGDIQRLFIFLVNVSLSISPVSFLLSLMIVQYQSSSAFLKY